MVLFFIKGISQETDKVPFLKEEVRRPHPWGDGGAVEDPLVLNREEPLGPEQSVIQNVCKVTKVHILLLLGTQKEENCQRRNVSTHPYISIFSASTCPDSGDGVRDSQPPLPL